MKKILDLITEEMEQAFADAGYEKELARVTLSNRPDLCEYQCNGAMAGAKKYKKAPIMIANDVVAALKEDPMFDEIGSRLKIKEIQTDEKKQELLTQLQLYYKVFFLGEEIE